MARRRRSTSSDSDRERERRRRRHDSSSRNDRARRRSRERRKRSEEKRERDRKDRERDREKERRRSRSRSEKKDRKPLIEDDKDGHLIYRKGDVIKPSDGLQESYTIVKDLGEGTFGKVVEVADSKNNSFALKIIRNISKYRDAARYEIRVLKKLRDADPHGDNLVIPLVDNFDYHGHACLVFPLLGLSVFDFLRDNEYYPFPVDHVRHIGYQLAKSVLFMHQNKLTHTDLKPENLMFRHRSYKTVKEGGKKYRIIDDPNVILIDLGGATLEDEHHTTIVSTRHYRAPEVILELGWSHPCDVWSVGCILFELYTGYTLFQTHDSREHLAIMERALGRLPSSMTERSKTRHFRDGKLAWDENSADGKYVKEKIHTLEHHQKETNNIDHDNLFAVIRLMLEYDPAKRITLDKVMEHEFFDQLPDDIKNAAADGAALPA